MVYPPRFGVMQATRSLVKSSAARSPCAEGVLDNISNAVHGSNIQWRGRSFAASVPSDSSKFQKVKKRLSKHERYSMIKSFVDRYRDINAGKFPTISTIKKETGGSHYTIREIIQRIQHEYCKQSVDKKFEAPADKPEKKVVSRIEVEKESLVSNKFKVNSGPLERAEKSDSLLETGTTGKVDDHKILDGTSQHIIVDCTGASAYSQSEVTKTQAATNSEASSKQDPAVHHAIGRIGVEVAQPLDVIEGCKRDETMSKGPDFSSVSHGQTTKSMATQEESSPERSTLWGRVKSLADGFISFWKKM